MAYAELAGLPPVTGLYATLLPLLVYAVFGPSRILVVGPDSAVAPLVAAAIIPLAAPGDLSERIELAGVLALLVGGLCILGGIAKFGFMTDLLSKPVRVGYLAGIALTVIASQLPKLFGFSVDGDSFVAEIRGFVGGIDQTNWQALAIGLACLAVIVLCRVFAPKVPGVFIAVVGATVVVRCARPCGQRCGRRRDSVRAPVVRGSLCHRLGSRASRRRSGCDRLRRVRGHERPLTELCRPPQAGRRSEPGTRGTRGGERSGRLLPGIPDLEQLVPNAGGGVRRVEDPAHRRRRGGEPGPPPRVCDGPREEPPVGCPRRRRDGGRRPPDRRGHAAPPLARPALGSRGRAGRIPRRHAFGVLPGIGVAVGLSLLDLPPAGMETPRRGARPRRPA